MKHVLRQSEEELKGKELASRERIENLVATVRLESAGLLPTGDDGGHNRDVGTFDQVNDR